MWIVLDVMIRTMGSAAGLMPVARDEDSDPDKACEPCGPQPVAQGCVGSPEPPFARALELSLSTVHLRAGRLIARLGKLPSMA